MPIILNYYALLALDTIASPDEVRFAIDRALCTLKQGGWKAWLLKIQGLDLEALAFIETIASDPMLRRHHDQDLFEWLTKHPPPPPHPFW